MPTEADKEKTQRKPEDLTKNAKEGNDEGIQPEPDKTQKTENDEIEESVNCGAELQPVYDYPSGLEAVACAREYLREVTGNRELLRNQITDLTNQLRQDMNRKIMKIPKNNSTLGNKNEENTKRGV